MPPALGFLPFDATPSAVTAAALVLLLALAPLGWMLRWLLGPLFAIESARLARRGIAWLRAAYASALLIALYVGFPTDEYADWRKIAEFARDFSELFLIVQSVTALLLTPLVFAGAVSDEKEKRSLDFLLTTDLSAREIVLGKYAARLLTVTSVLFTGLPVLALTMLWGGVDLLLVATVFAATFLAVVSFGAICLLFSVISPRTVPATSWSFGVLFVLGFCTAPSDFIHSPLAFQQAAINGSPFLPLVASPPDPLDMLAEVVPGHGVIALLALALAAYLLRSKARPPAGRPIDARSQLPPIHVALRSQLTLTVWRPIGRLAIAWKENYLGRRAEMASDALWLYFGIGVGLVGMFSFFIVDMMRDLAATMFFAIAEFLSAGLCIGLFLQIAGTITREREGNTLESLLAIPESRARILGEKLLGAVLRRRRWIAALVGLLSIAMCTGAWSVTVTAAAASLAAAHAAFVAGLCLVVSLDARSTVRAYLTSALILAAIIAATGVVARYQGDTAPADFETLLRNAMNPIEAWRMSYRLNFSANTARFHHAASLFISSSVYLTAAFGLTGFAMWRFGRTQRYA